MPRVSRPRLTGKGVMSTEVLLIGSLSMRASFGELFVYFAISGWM